MPQRTPKAQPQKPCVQAETQAILRADFCARYGQELPDVPSELIADMLDYYQEQFAVSGNGMYAWHALFCILAGGLDAPIPIWLRTYLGHVGAQLVVAVPRVKRADRPAGVMRVLGFEALNKRARRADAFDEVGGREARSMASDVQWHIDHEKATLPRATAAVAREFGVSVSTVALAWRTYKAEVRRYRHIKGAIQCQRRQFGPERWAMILERQRSKDKATLPVEMLASPRVYRGRGAYSGR